MKSQTSIVAAAAVLAATATAQGPTCASSCFASLFGNGHTNSNPWNSICTDTARINTLNSCIASSSCSAADKEGTYQAIAQLCANTGATITAAPEATFSATSGGSAYPASQNWASYASQNGWGGVYGGAGGVGVGAGASNSNWGSAWSSYYSSLTANPSWTTNSWASYVSNVPWTTNPSWTTNFGAYSTVGPWASGYAGPRGPFGGNWGGFTSEGAWTTGPWTAWWGGSACPGSTWSGWTSGPWGTNAPWTTWAGCTEETTATSVITTTSSGSVITTTSYGLRVAAVVATATSTATATAAVSTATASAAAAASTATRSVASAVSSAVASATSRAAAPTQAVAGGALVAALFGAVVAL